MLNVNIGLRATSASAPAAMALLNRLIAVMPQDLTLTNCYFNERTADEGFEPAGISAAPAAQPEQQQKATEGFSSVKNVDTVNIEPDTSASPEDTPAQFMTLVEFKEQATAWLQSNPTLRKAMNGLIKSTGSDSLSGIPEDQRAGFLDQMKELTE